MADDKEDIYALLALAQEQQKIIDQQQKQISELLEQLPTEIDRSTKELERKQQQLHEKHRELLQQFQQRARSMLDWRFMLYTTLASVMLFCGMAWGFYLYAGHKVDAAAEAQATTERFQALNAAYLGKCRDEDGSRIDCVSVDLEQGRWVVDGNEVRAIKKK